MALRRGTRRLHVQMSGEFLVRKGEELLSPGSRVRLTGPPNDFEVAVLAASLIGAFLVMTPWFHSLSLNRTLENEFWLYFWSSMLAFGSAMALVGMYQPFRDPTRGANIKAIGLLAFATAMGGYCISVLVANPRSAVLVGCWTGFLCVAAIRRALLVFGAVKKVLK